MARSQKVATTVTLDEVDYEVSGVVYPGTPARPWAYHGEGDPGDPGEISDITIKREDGTELDYDALSPAERGFIDDALMVAADDEAEAARSDADDRAYDDWKDRRMGL